MTQFVFRCTGCGKEHIISISERHALVPHFAGGGGHVAHYQQMGDSMRPLHETAAPAPQFTRATRKTPARAPNKEADVSVPFLKSLITGGLVGLPVSMSVTIWLEWPWWCVPAIASSTVALSWLVFNARVESLLWIVEEVLNQDIDGDGHQGKPEAPCRVRIEVDHSGEERQHMDLLDLPAPSPSHLKRLAWEVAHGGASFAERTATSMGYSQSEWKQLRDEFLERGWAYWRHPNNERQGVGLTVGGRAILRAIADSDL